MSGPTGRVHVRVDVDPSALYGSAPCTGATTLEESCGFRWWLVTAPTEREAAESQRLHRLARLRALSAGPDPRPSPRVARLQRAGGDRDRRRRLAQLQNRRAKP